MTVARALRCAIYTRVSTDHGLEQDVQLARRPARGLLRPISRARPTRAGCALRDHFDDGGFSGGSMERPALQELLADDREPGGSISSWSTRSIA